MICNDRQFAVSCRKRMDVLEAAEQLEGTDRAVYEKLAEELSTEIDEYLGVRDGYVISFSVQSLDEIADALIKARISRGLTHHQLAELLGVTAQMVQRDEAGAYEKAGLARLAEVADVLGYTLTGQLHPAGQAPTRSSSGSVANPIATLYPHWMPSPPAFVCRNYEDRLNPDFAIRSQPFFNLLKGGAGGLVALSHDLVAASSSSASVGNVLVTRVEELAS